MQIGESTRPKCSSASASMVKKERVTPRADIFENETTFGVVLDIPGVNQKDIEISVENGILTLEAMPESAETPSFYRQFRLSSLVDSSGVQANLKNGVLELILPKSAESRRRIIALSSN